MGLKRRTFLAGSMALTAGAATTEASAAGLTESRAALLRALLDTLLPGDGAELPPATALKVDVGVLREIARSERFADIVAAGLDWVEAEAARAGGRFAELDVDTRENIFATGFAAERGGPAQAFLHRLRLRAFRAYYTQPESWAGLGFTHPPQPFGYPDYDKPPQTTDPDKS